MTNTNIPFRKSKTASAIVVSLALFTDMLAYGLIIPILPVIITQMGKSKTDLGLLVGAFAIGLLIFTPIFGILSDYYKNRRFFMVIGLLGLCVANLIIPLARNYEELLLARIFQGCSSGASWTIGLSMIADVYDSAEIGVAMGFVMSANVVGQLIGPPVGGLLFKVSKEAPFIFCAFLAFVDLVARVYVKPVNLSEKKEEDVFVNQSQHVSVVASVDDEEAALISSSEVCGDFVNVETTVPVDKPKKFGIFQMLFNYPLFLLNLETIVMGFIYSGFEATFTVYAREHFGFDEAFVGLMFTTVVIPNIFLSVLAGHLSNKYGNLLMCSFGTLLLCFVCPFISLPPNTPVGIFLEVVILMILGSSAAIAITPILPEMSVIVEQNGGASYGQVYALFNMAYSVGMLVGPVVASLVYERVSFFFSVCLFSVVCLPVALLLFIEHLRRKSGGYERI